MTSSVVDARIIASFVSGNDQGNKHLVLLVNTTQAFDEGALLSIRLKPLIVVMLHIETITLMRAFHCGCEVMRCGSGSMAAGHLLSEHMPDKEHFCLHTIAGKVEVGKKGKFFYYQTSALAYQTIQSLSLWKGIINRPFTNAYFIGEKSDYCLLVLNSERDVARCKLNGSQLMRFSQRALIVSAPSNRIEDDYVIRYFNPRGGQYEDAATGSANAMVAPFWQQRIGKNTIRGRQLSSQGGMFVIKKIGLQQRVYGETSESPQSIDMRDVITRIDNNELGFD